MERTAEEFVHQLPTADNAKGKRWFVGDFQSSGKGEEGDVFMLTDGRVTTTWHVQRGITRLYATKSSAKRAAQRWLDVTSTPTYVHALANGRWLIAEKIGQDYLDLHGDNRYSLEWLAKHSAQTYPTKERAEAHVADWLKLRETGSPAAETRAALEKSAIHAWECAYAEHPDQAIARALDIMGAETWTWANRPVAELRALRAAMNKILDTDSDRLAALADVVNMLWPAKGSPLAALEAHRSTPAGHAAVVAAITARLAFLKPVGGGK